MTLSVSDTRVFRGVLLIVLTGVLLGAVAVLRSPPPVPPPDAVPVPLEDRRPAFASHFVHFFPGRTHTGARPRARSPLLRATTFAAGERVGLRIQTVAEFPRSLWVELRFLTASGREELPSLRDDRQRFRIRSGLRTYCCLRIPQETGSYVLGILVDDQYLAFLPLTIKEPLRAEGGLLSPASPEGPR